MVKGGTAQEFDQPTAQGGGLCFRCHTEVQQIQLNETLQPEMQKAADFFFPRQGFLFGHIRQQ